jgi:hypothetical protein
MSRIRKAFNPFFLADVPFIYSFVDHDTLPLTPHCVVQDATAILNQAYDILSLTLQKNPTSSSCGPLSSSSSGHMVRIPMEKRVFMSVFVKEKIRLNRKNLNENYHIIRVRLNFPQIFFSVMC